MGAEKKRDWAAFLVTLLAVSALVIFTFFGEYGLIHSRNLQQDYDQIQARIATLAVQNERLQSEIHALSNDPNRMEKLIRSELGMVREDETVFLFEK